MTAALETVLVQAGLRTSPARFLSLVEDAAKRYSPPHSDPADYFSPEQRSVLEDVGLNLNPSTGHELEVRARTIAADAVLRDSAITAEEAASRIGVDSSGIRRRLNEDRLIGWKDRRGSWQLPVWQFTDDDILPGLTEVLAELPDDQPPLAVASFMATVQPDLIVGECPVTPREWLLAGGDPKRVAELLSVLGTPA